ncbi:MAG: hypothetical protein ACI9BK_002549 [Acidimicrobiales bacterium]
MSIPDSCMVMDSVLGRRVGLGGRCVRSRAGHRYNARHLRVASVKYCQTDCCVGLIVSCFSVRLQAVDDDNHNADDGLAANIVCTAIDNDWGDDRPNMLMHPPCQCQRCAPNSPSLSTNDGSWLMVPGQRQRLRVAPAELGETGRNILG